MQAETVAPENGPGSKGWGWGGIPKVPILMGMWLVQALNCVLWHPEVSCQSPGNHHKKMMSQVRVRSSRLSCLVYTQAAPLLTTSQFRLPPMILLQDKVVLLNRHQIWKPQVYIMSEAHAYPHSQRGIYTLSIFLEKWKQNKKTRAGCRRTTGWCLDCRAQSLEKSGKQQGRENQGGVGV